MGAGLGRLISAMKNKPITQYAADCLKRVSIDDEGPHVIVKLPEMMADYKDCQEFLVRLEGDYQSGRRQFAFDYNPSGTIAEYADRCEMPPKNPFAFFPTPHHIARKAASCFDLTKLLGFDRTDTVWVLEPSAGRGALLDHLLEMCGFKPDDHPGMEIDVVEFDALNAERLRRKGYTVTHEGDFLEFDAERKYQIIIMNPPFAVAGKPTAYIEHVRHAYSMLADDGKLVAIVPTNYETMDGKKVFAEFKTFIENYGAVINNGKWQFADTPVDTNIVVLTKTNRKQVAETKTAEPVKLDKETWSKNLYWTDIGPNDKVYENRSPDHSIDPAKLLSCYFVPGKGVIYWTGTDAERAQKRLADIAIKLPLNPPKTTVLDSIREHDEAVKAKNDADRFKLCPVFDYPTEMPKCACGHVFADYQETISGSGSGFGDYRGFCQTCCKYSFYDLKSAANRWFNDHPQYL